jgi:hypothetical protein
MYPFNRALAVIAYAIVRVKVVWVSVLASTTKRVLKATDVRLGLKTRVPILMRWVCVFNTPPEIPGFEAFLFRDKPVELCPHVSGAPHSFARCSVKRLVPARTLNKSQLISHVSVSS